MHTLLLKILFIFVTFIAARYDHRVAKQFVQNMFFQWEKTTVRKSPDGEKKNKK